MRMMTKPRAVRLLLIAVAILVVAIAVPIYLEHRQRDQLFELSGLQLRREDKIVSVVDQSNFLWIGSYHAVVSLRRDSLVQLMAAPPAWAVNGWDLGPATGIGEHPDSADLANAVHVCGNQGGLFYTLTIDLDTGCVYFGLVEM